MFDFLRFLALARQPAHANQQRRPTARHARPCVEVLEERRLLTGIINDFPIPTTSSTPLGIVAGQGGFEWFTESGANKIAAINTATNVITEYAVPTANSGPSGIAVDKVGDIWFTELNADQIGMMNPSTHGISEFVLPTSGAEPYAITLGADGNLYFTEAVGNRIGEINPLTDQITEFAIPTGSSSPAGITAGPDGNIWFTESHGNKIGVLNLATDVITDYAIPTANSQPYGITTGSDGNLWFTEYNGNHVSTINPTTKKIFEFNMLASGDGPFGITTGPNGNIFFTEIENNAIGQLNVANSAITEYPIPHPAASAYAIAPGPDGNVWFAESATGYVGNVLVPPTVLLNPKSQDVAPGDDAVFTALAGTNSSQTSGLTIVEPGQVGLIWQTFPIAAAPVQWEVSVDNGVTYFPLTDGTIYTGTNTNLLTINDATTSMDGYKYEAIFGNGLISTPATLTVVVPLVITSFIPGGMVGANYNQTISVSGSATALSTFTVKSFNAGSTGLTASDFTINAAAGILTINGTPTSPGTATFTISASNPAGAAIMQAYTIPIVAPLSITAALPAAIVDVKYKQTLTVTGGELPYTSFALNDLVTGATGFTANSFTTNAAAGTIVISGMPKALGTLTFTVDVIDTAGNTLTKAYTIAVLPPLSITASLPADTVNQSYDQTLTLSGGVAPYASLTVTGFAAGTTDLTAADFTVNGTNGAVAIVATPTRAGTATFTVSAIDADGNTLTKAYSLVVNPAPSIAGLTKTQWTVNQTGFNGTFTISGGTGPFTLASSADLPTGLTATLTGNTISFTGIPSAANTFVGGTVTIADAAGATATATFTITINAAPSFNALTQTQWTISRTGFTGAMTINNGTGPFTIASATGLPTGLTAALSGATIHFAGTPSVAKAFTGSITVTDAAGAKITTPVAITINPALSVPASLPQGTAGASYVQTVQVSGGTGPFTTFTVTGFSAGATGLTAADIVPSAGSAAVAVNGTPSAAGTASFTLTAIDSAGAELSKSYTLTVNAAPAIGSLTKSVWDAGVPSFPGTLAITAGTASFTVAASSGLPTGLTAVVSGRTISFTGTPTVANTFSSASITIRDAAGATVMKTFSITINPALAFPSSLPQATSGANYDQAITVTGGTGPYTNLALTSFSAGTTGLAISAVTRNMTMSTLTINGTPSNGGTIILTAIAVDSLGVSLVKTYAITVNAVPYLTSLTQTQWTKGMSGFTGTLSIGAGTLPFTIVSSSGLPTGLIAHLNGRTISFTGTPTVAGTFGACTVTIKDTNGATVTTTFSITINPPLAITTLSLPTWSSFTYYTATVNTSGGTGPLTFAITSGKLPAGLVRSAAGKITGLSHAAGTFTFTITATDATGATSSEVYTI